MVVTGPFMTKRNAYLAQKSSHFYPCFPPIFLWCEEKGQLVWTQRHPCGGATYYGGELFIGPCNDPKQKPGWKHKVSKRGCLFGNTCLLFFNVNETKLREPYSRCKNVLNYYILWGERGLNKPYQMPHNFQVLAQKCNMEEQYQFLRFWQSVHHIKAAPTRNDIFVFSALYRGFSLKV